MKRFKFLVFVELLLLEVNPDLLKVTGIGRLFAIFSFGESELKVRQLTSNTHLAQSDERKLLFCYAVDHDDFSLSNG